MVMVRLPTPSGFSGEKASVTSSLRKITCAWIRLVSTVRKGKDAACDTSREHETPEAAESKESREERDHIRTFGALGTRTQQSISLKVLDYGYTLEVDLVYVSRLRNTATTLSSSNTRGIRGRYGDQHTVDWQ